MFHELLVRADSGAVAAAAATYVAQRARDSVAASGGFTFAVSGGHTPWEMFRHLADEDVPWERVTIFQVDERVAPADDPDRNLAHLHGSLAGAPARVRAMPVEVGDLEQGAQDYALQLPEQFDLIHLGLGPDGHTASLVPGDPVLDVADRLVAVTGHEYQGRRRMTLTYPALSRARQLLWLVTGTEKQQPLRLLLGGDRTIPAGRVAAGASLILADAAAADEGTGAG